MIGAAMLFQRHDTALGDDLPQSALLDLALAGITRLTELQASALAEPLRAKHAGDPLKL